MGIPPLPITQPVEKPLASTQQMRSAGLAGVELASQSERIASEGMNVEDVLLRAQRQLWVKQGEIAFHKYQQQVQEDLSKTTSIDDVDKIHENYQNDAPNVTTPYAKDPQVGQALGLYAQSQSVEMQGVVNARKAKIITDQDVAANQLKGEKSSQDWTNAFLSGGDVSLAEGDERLTLQSSVLHGTMTQERADAEFQNWLLKTKQSAIEGMMNSPDPVQRRKFIDQLKSGNVPKELDGLDKGFLNRALESAEGKDAELRARAEAQDVNTKFNNLLGYFGEHQTLFPSPESKLAATANPDVLKSVGAVTPEGLPDFVAGTKLRSLMEPIISDENVAAVKNANKLRDQVTDLYSQGKVSEGLAFARAHQEDFDKAHTDYFPNLVNSGRTYAQWEKTEAREARTEANQKWEDEGWISFSSLSTDIVEGKVIDPTLDVWSLVGKKELTPPQARELISMYNQSTQHTAFTQGLKIIKTSPSFANTDEGNAANAKMQAQFTQAVRQENLTGEAITERAKKMVDDAGKESTSQSIEHFWNNLKSGLFKGSDIEVSGPGGTAPPTSEYKLGDFYQGKKIIGINPKTRQLNVEGLGVVPYGTTTPEKSTPDKHDKISELTSYPKTSTVKSDEPVPQDPSGMYRLWDEAKKMREQAEEIQNQEQARDIFGTHFDEGLERMFRSAKHLLPEEGYREFITKAADTLAEIAKNRAEKYGGQSKKKKIEEDDTITF